MSLRDPLCISVPVPVPNSSVILSCLTSLPVPQLASSIPTPPVTSEAVLGHFDVEQDILDQGLARDIVVLGSDEAHDQQLHLGAIEVVGEDVQDVHFLDVVRWFL